MLKAKVTSKGQITIPKEVRNKLGIQPGENIAFEKKGDVFYIEKTLKKSLFDRWVGKLKTRRGHKTDETIENLRGEMITAVDTNILLDILIPDENHFQKSKGLLDEYVQKGQLIICEIVYAELASQFLSEKALKDFLSDTGIRLIHSTVETLCRAGERWKVYVKNKKQAFQCPQCGVSTSIICHKCNSVIKIRQHILSVLLLALMRSSMPNCFSKEIVDSTKHILKI